MITCLIGSVRFKEAYELVNRQQTLEGKIVLSCGVFDHTGLTEQQRSDLNELHRRKIDLADTILVLNVGGYIGEQTRNEINYALSKGKHISYLEYCNESARELVCYLPAGHNGWHRSPEGYEFIDDIIISPESDIDP
jgi:cell division protein FtsB